MGGHGGLNILPQKKWNVYNYENRDIVERDKKIHAQKMRNKYKDDRKNALQNKFEVLKGQSSKNVQNQENFKKSLQKDSLLNNQFKRLAEENQHVNLFQHEQKILENREVMEFRKLKEAQFLKEKDLDYSSKFLGTYNDDSKMPWYAKTKNLKQGQSLGKKQRYDMEDLVDQIRAEKDRSKNRYYRQSLRDERQTNRQRTYNFSSNYEQQNTVKRQQPYSDRQRSRDRKFEFLKRRQEFTEGKVLQSVNQVQISSSLPPKNAQDQPQQKPDLRQEPNDKTDQQQPQNEMIDGISEPKKVLSQQEQEQLERLRIKRLKREQKQRKRINQLKRKLLQSAN